MTDLQSQCIFQKRFLFWKYRVVEHDFRIYRISKFMDSSKHFEVTGKCQRCGCTEKRSFVTNDELLLLGISQEDLNEVSSLNWFYPHGEN